MEQKIKLLNRFILNPIFTLNKKEIEEVNNIIIEINLIIENILKTYTKEKLASLSREIEDLPLEKKVEINEIFMKLDIIKDSNRSPFSSGVLRIFSPNLDNYSNNFLDLDLPSFSDIEPMFNSPYSSGKLEIN